MREHFRIGTRGERVASSGQKLAELAIVIDLAVENRDNRACLAGGRLSASLDVDDCEATDPEGCLRSRVLAAVVRAPVFEAAEHSTKYARGSFPDEAANPAHRSTVWR